MLIATFCDVFSWRLPVKILSDSRIYSVSRLLQQLSVDKAAFPTICVFWTPPYRLILSKHISSLLVFLLFSHPSFVLFFFHPLVPLI